MKIAILTQYYKPETGAPQNRLYEMAVGLKSYGADISIITGMPNYPTGKIFKEYKNKFFCKEKLDDIKILRYWLYASNSKRIFPRILNMFSFSICALLSFRYLRKYKFDFIIVESPPLLLGVTGYILAKACGIKLVLNVSDLWPLSAKELDVISEGVVYKMLERIETFLYRKSAICMGQSQEIVNYISEHGASIAYLFRNGVDPDRFKAIEKCKIDNHIITIVYAGLLGFAQGLLDICKNIDFYSLGVEFHIYGAGGEQEAIEQYIKANPQRGIHFHGKVNRDRIPLILSQSDVTLVPLVKNIYGAVPSKIYESMAAGTPILFAGEGEGKRIVEENGVGWTSGAKDYEELTDNIKWIKQNPDDIFFKEKKCRNAAECLFNRPIQIEKLHIFLENFSS